MSARIMTLQHYQTLAIGMRDVQIIETDGLLITRGLLEGSGYVLALQPFASKTVTLIHEIKSPERAASASFWSKPFWLGRVYGAA